MITLKTLHKATDQEVFNQVAEHLLAQNKRSVSARYGFDDFCAYRGKGGLKCAVGCLIGDDEYDSDMEFRCWEDVTVEYEGHTRLIVQLQDVHDRHPPERWVSVLTKLAIIHNLEFKHEDMQLKSTI